MTCAIEEGIVSALRIAIAVLGALLCSGASLAMLARAILRAGLGLLHGSELTAEAFCALLPTT